MLWKLRAKTRRFRRRQSELASPSGGGAQCAHWAERALSVTACAVPALPEGEPRAAEPPVNSSAGTVLFATSLSARFRSCGKCGRPMAAPTVWDAPKPSPQGEGGPAKAGSDEVSAPSGACPQDKRRTGVTDCTTGIPFGHHTSLRTGSQCRRRIDNCRTCARTPPDLRFARPPPH